MCINGCLKLDYNNYEIIVLPDYKGREEIVHENVRVLTTGRVSPMVKRLMAAKVDDSELLAFIDSDAYPDVMWLKNAIIHFNDPSIVAVAGPNLTPENSSVREKAAGLILSSPFCGGSEAIRYGRYSMRYVSEAPTCNLIVRTCLMKAMDNLPDVWPGEEIVFCGRIVKDLNKKIIYDHNVIVYHKRRPLFIPYIKQIWSYGVVKGFILKRFPKYVRPIFYVPSLLVIGLIIGFLFSMINPIIRLLYVSLASVYIVLSFLSGILAGLKGKSVKVAFLVFTGIIATHICYGLAFIKGLLSRRVPGIQ
jgi:cellulose synthase/poly-beta-1,6-N-acetylglucosamine synthase-like glycosyltransferase